MSRKPPLRVALSVFLVSGCMGHETEPGPVCGNGAVEKGEQCDDGNIVAWDGCSAACQAEPSCADVVPTDDPAALQRRIGQAMQTGIASINASGVKFDWDNIDHRQMLFDRLPAELGCVLDLGDVGGSKSR